MVYNDKNSTFNELLEEDGSVSIHHQILQKLAIESFNVSRDFSPEIIIEIFPVEEKIT